MPFLRCIECVLFFSFFCLTTLALAQDESQEDLCRQTYWTICCDKARGEIVEDVEFGVVCETGASGSGCIHFNELNPNDPIFQPGGCGYQGDEPVLASVSGAIGISSIILHHFGMANATVTVSSRESSCADERGGYRSPPRGKPGYTEECIDSYLCYQWGWDVSKEYDSCINFFCQS